jgi:hypothetical protein
VQQLLEEPTAAMCHAAEALLQQHQLATFSIISSSAMCCISETINAAARV